MRFRSRNGVKRGASSAIVGAEISVSDSSSDSSSAAIRRVRANAAEAQSWIAFAATSSKLASLLATGA